VGEAKGCLRVAISCVDTPSLEAGLADQFEDFLKIEYNNIAQAHFNINTAVGEFFKAYIAVVSLPISLGVIFAKPADLRSGGMLLFLKANAAAVAVGLGFVWLIGLMVLGYLICLRCRPAPRLWSGQGDRIGSTSRLEMSCSNSAGGTLPREL
jgi:hypothetical protein